MEKNILHFTVKSKTDLERCYPIMKELRPHLTLAEYISIYEEAHTTDQYEIIALEKEGSILAVMGYRYLTDFVRGRHIYIDDLVSSEKFRSQGLGAELLKIAEQIAKENQCQSLRLCTGLENDRGIKFYDRRGWIKRAYAYTKKLNE